MTTGSTTVLTSPTVSTRQLSAASISRTTCSLGKAADSVRFPSKVQSPDKRSFDRRFGRPGASRFARRTWPAPPQPEAAETCLRYCSLIPNRCNAIQTLLQLNSNNYKSYGVHEAGSPCRIAAGKLRCHPRSRLSSLPTPPPFSLPTVPSSSPTISSAWLRSSASEKHVSLWQP